MGNIPIKYLTHENFEKYGRILMPNEEDMKRYPQGRFYILEKAESKGWRMAYLEDSSRERVFLSNHPNTKETFEPLDGMAVLVVAPPKEPEAIEAFILDKPILLKEGVWHSEPLVFSKKVLIRINENLEVESEYYLLPYKIKSELFTEPFDPSESVRRLEGLGYEINSNGVYRKKTITEL